MSQRERDRLVVLRQVCEGGMKPGRAAELLGLSVRQLRRLRRRYEQRGDEAVVHGLRGRRANNAKPEQLGQRVLDPPARRCTETSDRSCWRSIYPGIRRSDR